MFWRSKYKDLINITLRLEQRITDLKKEIDDFRSRVYSLEQFRQTFFIINLPEEEGYYKIINLYGKEDVVRIFSVDKDSLLPILKDCSRDSLFMFDMTIKEVVPIQENKYVFEWKEKIEI